MPYIGKQPIVGNFQVCDAISVVNGQAAYTMQVNSTNVTPETAFHMLVSLNGVLQKPGSSFTISGSTITFASNLATGDVIDFIILLGDVLNIGAPSDDTVTAAKLNNTMISGLTALTSAPDDTDEFLISDAGTLKRIDASLVGGKDFEKISTAKSETDTTLLDISLTSGFRSYLLLIRFFPTNDNVNPQLRLSLDGGSSYLENSYYWGHININSDTDNDPEHGANEAQIVLNKNQGNGVNEGGYLSIEIDTSIADSNYQSYNTASWKGYRLDGSGNFRAIFGTGILHTTATTAATNVRLFYDSGDISEYHYTLYGRKA
jgi:hypothetical protein